MAFRWNGRRQWPGFAVFAVVALAGVLTGCDTTPVLVSGTVSAAPSGAGVGGVVVQVYADDAETLVSETTSGIAGGWALRASTLADGT